MARGGRRVGSSTGSSSVVRRRGRWGRHPTYLAKSSFWGGVDPHFPCQGGSLPTPTWLGVGEGWSPTYLAGWDEVGVGQIWFRTFLVRGGGGTLNPCGQINTCEKISFLRTTYVVGNEPETKIHHDDYQCR